MHLTSLAPQAENEKELKKIIKQTRKILNRSNLSGYIICIADEEENTYIDFLDGMKGGTGAILAYRAVDTIAKSMGHTIQTLLTDFKQQAAIFDEVEELLKELDETNDEDKIDKIEARLRELQDGLL